MSLFEIPGRGSGGGPGGFSDKVNQDLELLKREVFVEEHPTPQDAVDAIPGNGGVLTFLAEHELDETLVFNQAKTYILRGAGQAGASSPGPARLVWTGGAEPIVSVESPVKSFVIEDGLEIDNQGAATIGLNIPGGSVYDVRLGGLTIFPTNDFSVAQINLGTTGLLVVVVLRDVYLRSPDPTAGAVLLNAGRVNVLTGDNFRSLAGMSVFGSAEDAAQYVVSGSFHGGTFEGGENSDAVELNRAIGCFTYGTHFEIDGDGRAIKGGPVTRSVKLNGGFCSGGVFGNPSTYAFEVADGTGDLMVESMEFESFDNPAYAIKRVNSRRHGLKDCTLNSTGMVETDDRTNYAGQNNKTLDAALVDRIMGPLELGNSPAQSGHLRLPYGTGLYWRDGLGASDRSLLSYGELTDSAFFGSPGIFSYLRSNLGTHPSPVNGDAWFEVTGVSPARIAALKVRDGGVTRTIASVTF